MTLVRVCAVVELQVVRRQIAEPLGGPAEMQGDRVGGPDVQGQSVGEARLEEVPAVVLVEQGLGFLVRDGGEGELADRGPIQGVPDQVAPLTDATGEPVVDVLLGEVFECQFSLVDSGQKFQGDADAPSEAAVRRGRAAAEGHALAGASQQEPVQKQAGEVRVGGRLVGQLVLQLAGDRFEIFIPCSQYTCAEEEVPDVVPCG
ncbi:hypothetical protein ACFVT1_31065 [Streptomyces sp. NPDC057963]|uniref:hypothetical protein n=1 Tax=Streptomyces sp. NPDC057963 TaxID=3346290 RepID=UPI0036E1F892